MTTPGKSVVDFDHITDTIALCTSAALKFQFKVAQGHLQTLLTLFPGTKGTLKVYNNTLTSISEGLADHELTRAGALVEIKKANAVLEAGVAKNTDALSAPSRFDPEVLYKDLSKDTLNVYDTNMNEIQTKLNRHGVFTGYAPVVPIIQPPLDATKLKKVGITADAFAGYCILKKQFVAGITYDELKKLMSVAPGKDLSTAKQEALDKEALQHFKEVIEAKYKHLKLVQMGEISGWWGAYWFWFAPASEFKLLKSCTINEATVQSLKIKGWSFPFNRNTKLKHPKG